MSHGEDSFDTAWRRVASVIYQRPKESKIFGSVSLDVTDLEAYIELRRKNGLKITMTHLLFLGIARGIKQKVPAFNTYLKRGKIIAHKEVKGSLSVLLPHSREMSAVTIDALDGMEIQTLVDTVIKKVNDARDDVAEGNTKMKHVIAGIPWPFRGWLVRFMGWLTLDLGLEMPRLGLRNDRFGCFLLSNIGTIGLDVGYPSLFPNANLSLVITMGAIKTEPLYQDGQWIPRRMLTLGAAMDHRIVDGVHGGQLFLYLKMIAANPGLLEGDLKDDGD